ncbi:MAG TPA: hypothetical protein VHO25_03685 [Polyangiaceae bacterium]|nr:hypothetical protein [Polyangiaceae bacterium]
MSLRKTRAEGLTFLLCFVVLIAAVNLAWCLMPANDNPFALLSVAISVVTLGLVPSAWRMNTRALSGLVFVHLTIGALNAYQFWSEVDDRASRIAMIIPFVLAWSLWTMYRRATLQEPT